MPLAAPYCIAYRDGQFLTAQTMQTEADYFTNWITLQNRSLYNPGCLMGLEVTCQDGNRLSVTAGTGIDSIGNFLILPNDAVYAVLSEDTYPFYLNLRYPTPEEIRAAAALSQTLNMAAVLATSTTLPPPLDGIVLAKISLDQNGAITITDRGMSVTSRIQPQPPPQTDGVSTRAPLAPPAAAVQRQGTVDIPVEQLSKLKAPGDQAEMTIHYVRPGVPAFTARPRVVASVRGPRPYAVNVDEVGNVSFVLRVTVFIAAEPPESIFVDWMAITT